MISNATKNGSRDVADDGIGRLSGSSLEDALRKRLHYPHHRQMLLGQESPPN
jgi:hypothetical protein